jgi:hypothetical protein
LKEELLLNSSVFTGYVRDSGVGQVISRCVAKFGKLAGIDVVSVK